MRKAVLPIIFMLLAPCVLIAQSVEGIVTDTKTGEPLAGAYVLVKETKLGTSADEDGNYRIDLKEAGKFVLSFRYMGYQTVKKKVGLEKGETINMDVELSQKAYSMKELIITSTRTEVNRMNVPMTISSVSEEEIEKSSESNVLPVLSRKVPGMFVNRRGIAGYGVGQGAAGQISIRGTGGAPTRQVLVLVDGQPQMMGIFAHPFSDNYVSSDIQKAEVIRGPASVIYGSNAMGGVINLITKRPDEQGFSGNIRGQYGSFKFQKYAAAAKYHGDKASVLASYNHDETDGHRPNSAFRIDNGFGKIGYEISKNLSATANFRMTDFTFNDPGRINDTTSLDGDVYRRNFSLTIENDFSLFEGGLMLFHNYGEHSLSDGWESTDENYGFSFYQKISMYESTDINLGIDFKNYGGKGKPVFPPQLSNKWFDVTEKSVYAILHQEITSGLLMNAGLRLENHSEYGEEWLPQFGLNYHANPVYSFRAMVSKGFRNPAIQELYLFPSANKELQPETMWNYEAGVSTVQMEGRLNGDLAIFYSEGDNIIQLVPVDNPPPRVKNMNSGQFSRYGIETQWQYRISDNSSTFFNYSYLATQDDLIGMPEHMASAGGTVTHNGYTLSADGQYVNNLHLNQQPSVKEEWVVINARASKGINDYLKVFLSGENLLDTDYRMMYGYPMPGITLTAGLKVSW